MLFRDFRLGENLGGLKNLEIISFWGKPGGLKNLEIILLWCFYLVDCHVDGESYPEGEGGTNSVVWFGKVGWKYRSAIYSMKLCVINAL